MVDLLIVGAGLFGAVTAREAAERGLTSLVIDRRPHIAGNVYTEKTAGIHRHVYGPHIFHTNSRKVWDYVNRFASFNRFTLSTVANWHGQLYSLPFNMYTFNAMWGVVTPDEAREKIRSQREAAGIGEPRNLEEQALCMVGRDIYEKLIKGYTQKQWGRPCRQLPASVIKRLPVRFTYDNNYFDARWQGIPAGGYTDMVARILDEGHITVSLNTDFLADRDYLRRQAKTVVYTGRIDEYFDHELGTLEYRSLRFETEVPDTGNFQGNAIVNYTDEETPWTRIVEHKWFTFGKDDEGKDLPGTVITREYPAAWRPGSEPFYPVNDETNTRLYEAYRALAEKERNTVFGGRLGEYRYYDMDQVIARALETAPEIIGMTQRRR